MSATPDTSTPQTPTPPITEGATPGTPPAHTAVTDAAVSGSATVNGAPPQAPPPVARRSIPRPGLHAVLGWLALAPVLALSAVLNTHRLAQNGYANVFYSAGVRSMLGSFHDFLFNSFDPGGLITVDKPPLSLWVQVASAKLFGFSPLSLLLPEALVGVLTVAVLYAVMRRPFGRPAALVGALALAVFPSFVAVSRDNGVDPVLILLMLLACGAGLRAVRSGRLTALLGCAVLVGLAFNAKTLAAFPVVPGLAFAYLLCAPGPPLRRVLKLLVAGVLLAAVSFSWIAFVEATPASKRPYVGGATDNTELNLTFGYNGFGRVEGQIGGPDQIFVRLGAVAPFSPRVHTTLKAKKTRAPKSVPNPLLPDGHFTNPTPFGGPVGPLRLFHYGLGGQAAWMLPFALLGLLALALSVLWPARRAGGARPAPDGAAAAPSADGLAGVGSTTAGSQPVGTAAETAPDGLVATNSMPAGPADRATPDGPLTATSAPGAPTAASRWERLRRDGRTAGLLVFGGWFLAEAVLLSFSQGIVHPYYVSALAPGASAMVGAGAVAFARFGRGRDWRVALLVLAVAATVVAQLVLLRREHYAHWLPPVLIAATAVGVLAALAVRRLAAPAMALILAALLLGPAAFATTTWSVPVEGTFPAAGPRVAGGLGPYGITAHNVRVDRDLMRFIDARHPTRKWELLTVSSNTAASLILLGFRAGAVGGYSGTDPALDGPGLARLVARHEARYVVLGGAYSSRGGNLATQAVIRACRYIPSEVWLHFPRWSIYSLALYDCAGAARRLTSA
jgi:4-amino-4-deoxy-L-arabinose transferase-like glycosyltransferase